MSREWYGLVTRCYRVWLPPGSLAGSDGPELSDLDLADMYAAINYYLHNDVEAHTYLRRREAEADIIRADNERRLSPHLQGEFALNAPTVKTDTKFIVEVQNVKEVTLAAEADLPYWQDRLQGEALFPFNDNGKAELTISATELRSMGRRTNELTFGITVCERQEADSRDGVYLLHAFNSSRLFAWIERAIFHTPYYPGHIHLEDAVPATIQLSDPHGMSVNIQMGTKVAPDLIRDELWQGKIFLPRRRAHPQQPGEFFIAKLGGYTELYRYSPTLSSLSLAPRPEHRIFQWLLDSNVIGKEWRIRHSAVHARSKTFQRR